MQIAKRFINQDLLKLLTQTCHTKPRVHVQWKCNLLYNNEAVKMNKRNILVLSDMIVIFTVVWVDKKEGKLG